MLNSSRTAALAGILGGLALVGAGVAQAHAQDHAPGEGKGKGKSAPQCERDARGIHCSSTVERSFVTEDGDKVVIKQSRTCKTEERNHRVGPRSEEQQNQGLVINCSNTVAE